MTTIELILFIIYPTIISFLIAILIFMTTKSRKDTKLEIEPTPDGYFWFEISIIKQPEQKNLSEHTIHLN